MRRNNKFENYLFIAFSLITFILGLLIVIGKLAVNKDAALIGEHPIAFGLILMFFSFIFIVYGILTELKRIKFKKSSYYIIKKMTDTEIKNRLALLDEEIKIERIGGLIVISLNYKDGIFELNISEDQFNISFDYTDEGLYDSLSEEEKQRLDDMFYEGDSLKVSEKEIFTKFIEYVNTNKEIKKYCKNINLVYLQ